MGKIGQRVGRRGRGAAAALVVALTCGPAAAQIQDNPTWDRSRIEMQRRDVELERSRGDIDRGRIEADRLRDQPRPVGVLPPPPAATGEAVRRGDAAQRKGALQREEERLRERQQTLQGQEDRVR